MNNKGSITIYLSLILMVLVVFVASIIESTRIISSKTMSYQVSKTSLDASFSKFSKELFDDYGIFGLWKKEGVILSEYEKYVNESLLKTKDIFGLKLKNSKIKSIEYITEKNAENFVVQVDSLMKYKMTQDMINNIILKCNGLEKSDAVDKILNEIKKYQDIISYIDDDIFSTYEKIELLNKDIKEIPGIIEEMNNYLDKILNYDGSKSKLLSLKGGYEECYQILCAYVEELSDCVDDIYMYEGDYEKYTNIASKGLDNMNKVLEDVKVDCNEEVYKALSTMVNEYDFQIVNLDNDYFNMVHCKEETKKLSNYYLDIKEILEFIDKGIKEDSFILEMNIDLEIPKLNDYQIFYDISSREKGEKSVFTSIQNLFSDGFLSFVVDNVDEISQKNIDVEKLISKKLDFESGYKYKNFESDSELIRKVLYTQYIFDYFSCYLNDGDKEKAIDYEIEYIIAGKLSDRKNIENIISKLVLVREGLNMAYIVTDKDKMLEAEAMATTIVGALGMLPLKVITKWLIIGAWVTAESVVDVRLLLEGEDISLIKTKNEWNTGLNNLDKFYAKKYKNKKKKDSVGMGYKDYLRILLLSQNSVNQVYRTLDIIEMNMINKYNQDFRINDCVYKINIESEYRLRQLFNIPNIGKNLYTICDSVEMKY